MTVKVPVLVAVPPGVATPILPVFAPVGTVLVIWVSESTVKLVALTPPKLTLLAPVKLSPVITTLVPTGPLVGEKLEIVGVTRNFTLLVKVRLGVVTFTLPVVAPLGTVVVISVLETLNVAALPLNVTLVLRFRLFHRILTAAPTLPEVGSVSTKGPSPTDRLKIVPSPLAPPPKVVPYKVPSVPCTSPAIGAAPSGQPVSAQKL